MQFKKKPVVINAVNFAGIAREGNEIKPQFLMTDDKIMEAINKGWEIGENEVGGIWLEGQCLKIMTLEGCMDAIFGDYIIMGVKGELYPCKPDIFQLTYEKVYG